MGNDADAKLLELVRLVAEELQQRGWRLTTAESCTGGWIAKCCTDLPGSSTWFDGGYIAYSYAAKEQQLGVIHADLEVLGAVSEEIAAQMAIGARRQSGSDITVSATGIAGPGGGLPNKPVGLVCFGWSSRGGSITTASEQFSGDRDAIRRQTVMRALQGVLDALAVSAASD